MTAETSADKFGIGAWLFLRSLAVIHVIAFASAWTQIAGLIGPHGILPAGQLFAAVHQQWGAAGYWQLPSLCWIFGTGWFLHGMCAAGIVLALLLFAGIAPALCLGLLWADYLSLACAGQIFFDFQWDALLLEATFLSVFLAPWGLRPGWRQSEPPRAARWILGWLLFRLMFFSGFVKLAGGDQLWRHLDALRIHYETQPLPTLLAWYAHQLPAWFQRFSCAVMFVVELALPFCLFCPRRLRHAAVLAIIVFQVLIELTGNYTFFNLLTISLCFLYLDDAWWAGLRSGRGRPFAEEARAILPDWLLRGIATAVIVITSLEAVADFDAPISELPAVASLIAAVAPFRSLNNYGLFAQMTRSRPELIFQGSDDGRDWRSYELPHKPGDPGRRPDFVAPHQPRLDWQLWFAALGLPRQNRWVFPLCDHLLRGTPEVLALFAANPFPQHPPRLVRVVRYDYHFTRAAERARTGNWWTRDVVDFYVPAISLK